MGLRVLEHPQVGGGWLISSIHVHRELQHLPTQLTWPSECSPGGFGEEGAMCFHCRHLSPDKPVHPSSVFMSSRGSCWLEMATGAKPPPIPRMRDLKEPLSSKPSGYGSFFLLLPYCALPPSLHITLTSLGLSPCPVWLRGPCPAEECPAVLRHQ